MISEGVAREERHTPHGTLANNEMEWPSAVTPDRTADVITTAFTPLACSASMAAHAEGTQTTLIPVSTLRHRQHTATATGTHQAHGINTHSHSN